MREPIPNCTWTVAEVLDRDPRSIQAFTRLGMACVGCAMARFESLSEALNSYGIKLEQFLLALASGPAKAGGTAPTPTLPDGKYSRTLGANRNAPGPRFDKETT